VVSLLVGVVGPPGYVPTLWHRQDGTWYTEYSHHLSALKITPLSRFLLIFGGQDQEGDDSLPNVPLHCICGLLCKQVPPSTTTVDGGWRCRKRNLKRRRAVEAGPSQAFR
jgi:hypothetical protein